MCEGEMEFVKGESLSLGMLHWLSMDECRGKNQGQTGV